MWMQVASYMLRQNDERFYKGLYVTFKLAQYLKKNTLYLSSYNPLNEGQQTQCFELRRAYNYSINW